MSKQTGEITILPYGEVRLSVTQTFSFSCASILRSPCSCSSSRRWRRGRGPTTSRATHGRSSRSVTLWGGAWRGTPRTSQARARGRGSPARTATWRCCGSSGDALRGSPRGDARELDGQAPQVANKEDLVQLGICARTLLPNCISCRGQTSR